MDDNENVIRLKAALKRLTDIMVRSTNTGINAHEWDSAVAEARRLLDDGCCLRFANTGEHRLDCPRYEWAVR